MSRLSLADIDQLVHLHRKILNGSLLIDQLLERERFQGKSPAPADRNVEGTMRDALADLLNEITEAARGMVAIVNRDDEERA